MTVIEQPRTNPPTMSLELWLSCTRSLLEVTRCGKPVCDDEKLMVHGLVYGALLVASVDIEKASIPGCHSVGQANQLPVTLHVGIDVAIRKAMKLGFCVHGMHPEAMAALRAKWTGSFPHGFFAA